MNGHDHNASKESITLLGNDVCTERSDSRIEATAGLPIRWTLGRRWDNVITRADFKSETIFGFLSPNYTGQHT